MTPPTVTRRNSATRIAVCRYGAMGCGRPFSRGGAAWSVTRFSLLGDEWVSRRAVAYPTAGWPRRTRPHVPPGRGGPFGARAGGAAPPGRERRGNGGRPPPIGDRAR